MSKPSPLGSNYGWITPQDHTYGSRELTPELHDVLAVAVMASDPEVQKLERNLGYKVILAVLVGTNTLDLRIYKYDRVVKHPDNLASRLHGRAEHTFMIFNDKGGLEVLEGEIRMRAQGSAPEFYAGRRLSPQRVATVDALQSQFSGRLPSKIGLPDVGAPLEEEVWDSGRQTFDQSLEPAHDHTR